MVGVALLGAGIFAREEHLPAIEASSDLELKAVWSRSESSAQALAAAVKSGAGSVDIYHGYSPSAAAAGKSLDDLLKREDVEGVIIALPILSQPDVVEKALRAGKHVLSEKPIAGDVQKGQELVSMYRGLADGRPIWAVAENFRYTASLVYAAQKVKELREVGGELTTFRLQQNGFVKRDNKYWNTEWRKVPEYQGGFLLDGGVHFVAGLRLLLTSLSPSNEISSLAAFSTLLEERLLPVDTVHAVAKTQSGKIGTISLSFGTEFKSGLEIDVNTTKGSVFWEPKSVRVVTSAGEETRKFEKDSGVKAEVAAFGKSIVEGKADPRQTPEEGLKDLEVLQRLLESGEAGASVKTMHV
ncbi:hypothetical protein QBC46DRAFT_385315 [Diplogelasinospora grovesii]|uniref:Uncharacterized protein n=1 Tax=Diplogelasinospora grovesii TaxID=303347 RepID=A0AAN6N8J2_9PEZI|nr:hypothetical protein QBC46DRAFT_385315 [Diplogelasinospora grovesii]